MRKLLILIFILVILVSCSTPKKPMKEIPKEQKQEMVQYLKTHWKSPEDYVVDKFKDYDIVFIGEYSVIKHDVELIHNFIPCLYQAGIYNLGIEFGCYENQDKVDALITADEYDEDLARWLIFKRDVTWGYKEYMDIYRKAWELNKSLPKDAPKFRVVNLDYRVRRNLMQENMPPETLKKIWHKGDPNEYMAEVIFKEFVDKGNKALIYSSSFTSFTHYHEPIYDIQNKKLYPINYDAMGNIIYNKIPNRVFNIFLHAPWKTKDNLVDHDYPVDGVIDSIMKEFKDKRVGFDVKGSPFGKLRDDDTYYAIGYDNFTLSSFCDGYIFQKHFSDYEGCTVDTEFITEDNLQEAIDYLTNPEARKTHNTIEVFMIMMRARSNIKKSFNDLE